MKNAYKIVTFLGIFFVSSGLVLADLGFSISQVHSKIDLTNQNVEITETIAVDISDPMYGLERFIPDKYSNGFRAGVNLLGAKNGAGEKLELQEFFENGNVIAQMIIPGKKRVSGEYTFVLDYEVTNIFSKSKFEWNINGTETGVATGLVVADVFFDPDMYDTQNLQCVTGKYGESNGNCVTKLIEPGHVRISAKNLAPFENLTFFIGDELSFSEQIAIWLQIYWPFAIPVFVFIGMYLLWWTKGRDDASLRNTVVPHYEPPEGLDPVQVGALYDFNVDPRDLTSLIIARAVAGDLKIIEKAKNDYELEQLREMKFEKSYEILFFSKLFPINAPGTKVSLKSLQYKFGVFKPELDDSVLSNLLALGMFKGNPKTVRAKYTGVAVFGFIILLMLPSVAYLPAKWMYSLGFSFVIAMFFGYLMPARTAKGAETFYKLKGLYEYIETAEKDRMKFQENNGLLFEKLLPYAAAFGLISKWTKAFEGILTEPPNWFVGRPGVALNLNRFGRSMNTFATTATNQMYASPGSQGGSGAWTGRGGFSGFSGGGFGGGGMRGLR